MRNCFLLIEEKAHGMYQKRSQQAIAQIPQITCPDSLHLATMRQLSEYRADEAQTQPKAEL